MEIINSTLPLGSDGYAVTPEKSFIDGLTTPKGSVIGKPEYGTEYYKLKHRGFNSSWIIDFKRCLKDACKHDPRLIYKNSTIDDSEIGNGRLYYEVFLEYGSIKGVLNV